METHPMTVKGAESLKNELHRLKFERRPAITAAIAEARAHGDLKENAEYHAAREEQGLNEAYIRDIENKLNHAKIVDISRIPNEGKVIFGSTVTVCQTASGTEMIFQIVGENEADVKQNKISYSSPIARALIGRFVDDVVSVKTPDGLVEYEIVDVAYI